MEKNHHQVLKQQQETPSSLSSQNHNKEIITSDRLKRDEWSEGAVSSLLEAYEAKWALRNRAKLKGQDWEEVAQHVSGRAGGSKSAKTQTQCKNKIESMKKRYRSESAAADGSSWPLYSRLDLLLRGNHGRPAAAAAAANPPSVVVEELPSDSRGADCGDRVAKIGESIRWVAEVVVRSEQARLETMKEIERMRAEADAKRGEMDLKRTEIIANTQLQIAKLFAKGSV
ncbi:hypothetical protein DH2020_025892 [Rehmannia glutinosa]|uniref:Myb/SANT-like DNA-binding domain-containing protein n=1 Tax=Rehmannia glutinosa TaxID=99300 RepID=A0ABR0VYF9_REHGL